MAIISWCSLSSILSHRKCFSSVLIAARCYTSFNYFYCYCSSNIFIFKKGIIIGNCLCHIRSNTMFGSVVLSARVTHKIKTNRCFNYHFKELHLNINWEWRLYRLIWKHCFVVFVVVEILEVSNVRFERRLCVNLTNFISICFQTINWVFNAFHLNIQWLIWCWMNWDQWLRDCFQ